MICPALTSLSSDLLKEIVVGRPRTIEVMMTHNILTVAEMESGKEHYLFLTSTNLDDLNPGDPGICAEILSINIAMTRIRSLGQSGVSYGENEQISARVQIRFCAPAFVKSIVRSGRFKPTTLEIVKTSCYHAK